MKLKVLDDRIFRDNEIRSEYRRLQQEGLQSSEDIRRLLSEKHFLSEKSIQRVIYQNDEEENTIFLINQKPFRMTTLTLMK